jgi:hypothetical protein
MRPRTLPLLLALLAAPALAADPPAPVPPLAEPPVAEPAPPPPPATEAPLPKLGLRLGVGLPDGASADLVFRPVPSLRLQAGPSWNYLAFGVQAGVAITPFRWAVSPVLEATWGHFFAADLNKVFKDIPVELQSLASSVGYDYLNGQVGIEFGSPSGFTFSIGLGLSYVWSDITGTATTVQNPGTPDEATVTVVNPAIRAVTPSLRLGMLFYF